MSPAQPVDKQQELLRTVFNVVTHRGMYPCHAHLLRISDCAAASTADNLCSFVEDEAVFGKVRTAVHAHARALLTRAV